MGIDLTSYWILEGTYIYVPIYLSVEKHTLCLECTFHLTASASHTDPLTAVGTTLLSLGSSKKTNSTD